MFEIRKLSVAEAVIAALMMLQSSLILSQELSVQDEAGKQTVLTHADIESLRHITVQVAASGKQSAYDGVELKSILEKAGVGLGESLKGKRLASCLLVGAADGYRVVIALPEIDPAFADKRIILALLKDGKPLDAIEGPYRIIIAAMGNSGTKSPPFHYRTSAGPEAYHRSAWNFRRG